MANNTMTPEIQEAIAGYVNAGVPFTQAAPASGVSYNTAKEWLAKGKAGDPNYVDFYKAIETARARWVAGAVLRISKAATKEWKAAAWLLERRYPEMFGQRTKLDAKLQHQGQVSVSLYVPDNGRGRDEDG